MAGNNSTGTTALATSGDTAVQALSSDTATYHKVVINNAGSAAGFFSLDGSSGPWHFIGAGQAIVVQDQVIVASSVYIKRIPSGTDMASVYVSLFRKQSQANG